MELRWHNLIFCSNLFRIKKFSTICFFFKFCILKCVSNYDILTTRPDKHSRVFLTPCKKWLAQRSLLYFYNIHPYGVHRTSHILQGTKNTRPCITGGLVYKKSLTWDTLSAQGRKWNKIANCRPVGCSRYKS